MILEIERLGHLGDGVAPGPVYVPMALPGERVEGDVAGDRMPSPRILTPSTDRVRAPCRHFRVCGGCALQHAAESFVSEWKADVVRRALAAHEIAAPVRRILTSPPGSRRRATLAARRTKRGATVGFHVRGSETIAEIPGCRVLRPEIVGLIPALQDLTALFASRKATLALAVTWSDTGADLSVRGGKPLDGALRADLAEFARTAALARLTWDAETVVTRHPPAQSFDGIAVVPPPGAFLQATEPGETALRAAVAEALGDAAAVVDLFAGCGTFALPAARTAGIHAVEGDGEMLAALDRAWRSAPGLKQVTTEKRDLQRRPLATDELARFDAAIIDPPRAGAAAQTAELTRSGLGRIASVSCNPVSFARDARALVDGGFRLDWIDVVDQFRWSPHVELAALFTRAHIARNR